MCERGVVHALSNCLLLCTQSSISSLCLHVWLIDADGWNAFYGRVSLHVLVCVHACDTDRTLTCESPLLQNLF